MRITIKERRRRNPNGVKWTTTEDDVFKEWQITEQVNNQNNECIRWTNRNCVVFQDVIENYEWTAGESFSRFVSIENRTKSVGPVHCTNDRDKTRRGSAMKKPNRRQDRDTFKKNKSSQIVSDGWEKWRRCGNRQDSKSPGGWWGN